MSTLFRFHEIEIREPFSTLFAVSPSVRVAIRENMEAVGFDQSKPVDLWKQPSGKYLLIDGHTRTLSAEEAKLPGVYGFVHDFKNEDEALAYAVRNQRDRRNLTQAELLRCVEVLDKRKSVGRPELIASNEAIKRTSESTADLLGVSRATVERARTVLDHADDATKDAVISGEKSINRAYTETQERRRHEAEAVPETPETYLFPVQESANPLPQETGMDELILTSPASKAPVLNLPVLPAVKERGLYLPTPEEVDAIRAASGATFNSQKGNDNIEWARWSWNPVTGCLHGCDYCYARDIANRFYEQGFTPTFIPERLAAPRNTKAPKLSDTVSDIDRQGWRNVFVCSMADLWGKWVPSEVIRYVLREADEQTQWTYLYLTKFPARYEEFAGEFPANTWVGTSVDKQHAVARAEKAFRKLRDAGHQGVRWLSIEPMLEPIEFTDLSLFDWIVIGGQSRSSQTPEFHPPFEWVARLYLAAKEAGCQVYFKTNLFAESNRVREYPLACASESVSESGGAGRC